MNLEKLQELWKEDCVIDSDLYCEESIRIPQLHQRYLEFYNTYSLMKKEKEGELNALKKTNGCITKVRHHLKSTKRCHLI
ncbi:MAG: hypothetical protein CM15mV36_0750 [Caudoviricetes sp.]|nr:MAG: hypothetical protein CM15mV36_0750 [Caudoviricetes sp.]